MVLVDAEDGAIGSCDKLAAHRNGALHRAFSILIVNPAGELLLQRRAAHKYHFAGRWSNACCGHPRPGEQTPEAARRRLREELGFSVPLKEVGNLRYRAVDPRSELIEHEYLHVFEGTSAGEPRPNPDEVGAYRWMRPSRVLRCVARRPDIFTPWFAILLDTLGTGSPRREAAEGTGGRRGGRDGAWSERDAVARRGIGDPHGASIETRFPPDLNRFG